MRIKQVKIVTDNGDCTVMVQTSPDYLQVGCSVDLIHASTVLEVAKLIVRGMKAALDE